MADFRVPPQCHGFEMQDGTKYNPNKDGVVHVEREDHARAIRNSYQAKDWGGGVVTWGWKYRAEGWDCVCGFSAFAWQDSCPRCKRAKVEEMGATA